MEEMFGVLFAVVGVARLTTAGIRLASGLINISGYPRCGCD
jgi:hypothetical protein